MINSILFQPQRMIFYDNIDTTVLCRLIVDSVCFFISGFVVGTATCTQYDVVASFVANRINRIKFSTSTSSRSRLSYRYVTGNPLQEGSRTLKS